MSVEGVTLQYKTPNHLVTATYRVGLEIHKTDRLRAARAFGLREIDAAQGASPASSSRSKVAIRLKGKPISGRGPTA